MCVLIALAVCNGPLLYDYTLIYKGSLNGTVLVRNSIVFSLIDNQVDLRDRRIGCLIFFRILYVGGPDQFYKESNLLEPFRNWYATGVT